MAKNGGIIQTIYCLFGYHKWDITFDEDKTMHIECSSCGTKDIFVGHFVGWADDANRAR